MKSRRWLIALTLIFAVSLTGIIYLMRANAQQPGSADGKYTFTRLTEENVTDPLYLTQFPDESGRFALVAQPGQIFLIEDGVILDTPFIDLRSIINSESFERGLLGLAFHPDFAENGYFFVYYTDLNGDTVVARYQVSEDDPYVANPDSAETLLEVEQPYANHNGGMLAFGPDGYLYIALGDGGSGGDPENNGQDTSTLLGTLLRIDVDSTTDDLAYGIPADNPLIDDADARPEIWAFGLRNPWRFSFDMETGDLYIADVGQGQWEEVNFEPADSVGGLNYGWAAFEGTHQFGTGSAPNRVMPVAEYDHDFGCSVTGGYVYRGETLPELNGTYFYGDFCSGIVWELAQDDNGDWQSDIFLDTDFEITSFGQDAKGELYLVDQKGGIYQLTSVNE